MAQQTTPAESMAQQTTSAEIVPVEPEGADQLTIDELARETGMTVRNIRAHQSRDLLPPPEVRSRTGYYGPEHAARLRLIQEMQAEGFNLRAIKRLIEGSQGASQEALWFKRSALEPFGDETPEVIDAAELESRLGGPFAPKTLQRLERLELVRPLGEGRYEVPSPTLLRAGEDLVSLGVPVKNVVAVAEEIFRAQRATAEAFVKLFVRSVADAGKDGDARSPERWAAMRETVERMRPLATQAVLAGFQQTMTRAVEREFGKSLGK